MKKRYAYQVVIGSYHGHHWSQTLGFVLEEQQPETALDIILRSKPYRDAIDEYNKEHEQEIRNMPRAHLVNFSGPHSYYWSD